MTTAVYPGTFDPVTLGHVDIVTRAAAIFGKLYVCIYSNPVKNQLFTVEERVELLEKSLSTLKNVEVDTFDSLVVDYARQKGAKVMVRGLRSGSDFEYEYEMAFMNKKLAPDVELVCLMTSLEYQFVSSSLMKEVAGLGGDVGTLVSPEVASAIHGKMELHA
ncbi:pantetheine-phosphate adenylyltransferase [SAR202 cluster bacterium AD-804-J14_MRT_500m]|nr:pantetheine-phosphate adenylyltransferase [SAR202 cluster bacterium AD-804-J14_MRT_500m]